MSLPPKPNLRGSLLKHWIVLLCCTVVGCASAEREVTSTGKSCTKEQWIGSYLVSATERPGGNCGAITSKVLTIPLTPLSAVCKYDPVSYSADACTVVFSEKCDFGATTGNDAMAYELSATPTGGAGKITTYANMTNQGTNCTSEYDVTFTKQ